MYFTLVSFLKTKTNTTLQNVDRTYFVSLTDLNNCKISQRPQDVLLNHKIISVGGRGYFENLF